MNKACLFTGQHIASPRSLKLPDIDITNNGWTKIKELVSSHVEIDIPETVALTQYYNVCSESLISEDSKLLWRLYNRVWKNSQWNTEEYLSMPALIEDAVGIIENNVPKEDPLLEMERHLAMMSQMKNRKR